MEGGRVGDRDVTVPQKRAAQRAGMTILETRVSWFVDLKPALGLVAAVESVAVHDFPRYQVGLMGACAKPVAGLDLHHVPGHYWPRAPRVERAGSRATVQYAPGSAPGAPLRSRDGTRTGRLGAVWLLYGAHGGRRDEGVLVWRDKW
jgi:hypothetical protein